MPDSAVRPGFVGWGVGGSGVAFSQLLPFVFHLAGGAGRCPRPLAAPARRRAGASSPGRRLWGLPGVHGEETTIVEAFGGLHGQAVASAGCTGRVGRGREPLGAAAPLVENGRANGFFKMSRNRDAHLRRCPRARSAQPAVGARPPASALPGQAGPGGGGDPEAGLRPGVAGPGGGGEPEAGLRSGVAGPGLGRCAAALRRQRRRLRPHPARPPGRGWGPGSGFSQQFRYFVQLPIFTQASLPPLNETPLLRDVQPLHLIKEIALQC